MFGLKKTSIPTGETKDIAEIESWTVEWKVLEGWGNAKTTYYKVLTNKDDANTFIKRLKECALFIKAPIDTSLIKN